MRKNIKSLFTLAPIACLIYISMITACDNNFGNNNNNHSVNYCDTALCPNFSRCDSTSKTCLCDSAFSYDSSSHTCTAARDKFLGQYTGTSSCVPAVSSVPVVITAETSDPAQFTITGLIISTGSIGPIFARANEFNQNFLIPAQTDSAGDNVSGTGTLISTDSIDIQYSVQGAAGTTNCEYIGTK